MKINSTPYPALVNLMKKEKTSSQVSGNSSSSAREQVQQHIAKMQEAANSTGENNPRVQALYEKFKSGKKLSLSEINYLRIHAPGLVAKIEQVHVERATYEQAMKGSPTKMGVNLVALHASQQINNSASAEDVEIRSRHLQDAITEYTATDDYRDKPEAVLEDPKEKKHKKWKLSNDDPDFGKLYKSSSANTVYTQQMVSAKSSNHTEK